MSTFEELYKIEELVANECKRILDPYFSNIITQYGTSVRKVPCVYINVTNNGPNGHLQMLRRQGEVLQTVYDTFKLTIAFNIYNSRTENSRVKNSEYQSWIQAAFKYKDKFRFDNHGVLDLVYDNTMVQTIDGDNLDIMTISYSMVICINPDAWPVSDADV